MKVIDVNILAYVISRPSALHKPVSAWWTAALRGNEPLALSWTTITGFLRVVTNPRALEIPLTADDALDRVEAWLAHPTVCLIHETDRHWVALRQLIRVTGISGKRVTDAHLAAMAVSRGATLVSCDHDFARFPQLRWENPVA
jgi:uncharacterized protein